MSNDTVGTRVFRVWWEPDKYRYSAHCPDCHLTIWSATTREIVEAVYPIPSVMYLEHECERP